MKQAMEGPPMPTANASATCSPTSTSSSTPHNRGGTLAMDSSEFRLDKHGDFLHENPQNTENSSDLLAPTRSGARSWHSLTPEQRCENSTSSHSRRAARPS